MNIQEALGVLWRRRSLILVIAVLGALAVWFFGRPEGSSAETYSASVSISATTSADEVNPIPQYAFVATDATDIAAETAADAASAFPDIGYTGLDVQRQVEVTPIADIGIMTIATKGEQSPELARLLVERFAFHLIEYVAGQRKAEINDRLATLSLREDALRTELAALNDDMRAARSRLTPAEVSAGVSPDPVKQTDIDVRLDSLSRVLAERDSLQEELDKGTTELRATTTNVQADPTSATPLGFTARFLLALALGLISGSGLALGLHRFDTRLYGRKDAETAFGLPVLAEIPKINWLRRRSSQLIARSHPEAPASEAYRLLRSSLAQAARVMNGGSDTGDRGGTVVLVTSVSEGTGKSSTVANLAVAAVDARKRVLVVSADLRKPMIHTYLGAAPGPGLTDAVDRIEEDGIELAELTDFLGPTTVRGTTILRSGHPVPHPGERLALAMPLIAQARHLFDLIVIDTPAMLLGNDVNEMIGGVDLVLLVARAGATSLEEAEWSREMFERLRAPVCGVALIGSSSDLQRRTNPFWRLMTAATRKLSRRRLQAAEGPVSPSEVAKAPHADEPAQPVATPPAPAMSAPAAGPTMSVMEMASTTLPIWPIQPTSGQDAGPQPQPPLRPATPYTPPSLAVVNGDREHPISANDLLASLGLEEAQTLSPQSQVDWLRVVETVQPDEGNETPANGNGERSDGDGRTGAGDG